MNEDYIKNFKIPRWDELPEIDLYLDQVVTFLESYLVNFIPTDNNIKKEKTSQNLITKTMINNYVKQKVLEPPIKKKYNKNHLAYLFCICILKQVYSINDVNHLIKFGLKTAPIQEAYDIFCEEVENAVFMTFKKQDYKNTNNLPRAKYILRNVAQTFASKLYVQKILLHK